MDRGRDVGDYHQGTVRRADEGPDGSLNIRGVLDEGRSSGKAASAS